MTEKEKMIKKNYEEQIQLPEKLVSETTKQQVLTINSWKKAKATKDYSRLEPDLEKLVSLNKKVAKKIAVWYEKRIFKQILRFFRR